MAGDDRRDTMTALADHRSRVLGQIDDEEVVRLAMDLVRIPSFTTEETPCAEWLATYLHEQGLEVELQEVEPGRKQTIAWLRGSGDGRGREHQLRGAYTVSDFCTAYVNVRFNASMTQESILADFRRTLDALKADDPDFEYEIEFPPLPERGLGRLCKAAFDIPIDQPIVQMLVRNLKTVTGHDPEHLGARLPQSYAGNDTTHLWAAGIPCCVYGPLGGYTDYHDVYTYLDELFTVTRVLASTALEATTLDPSLSQTPGGIG